MILKEGKVIRNEVHGRNALQRLYGIRRRPGGRGLPEGREVLGVDAIGGLRTAYVLGNRTGSNPELEVFRPGSAKLFIQL